VSYANKDKSVYDAMILLKRHLRACKLCISARKAGDPYMMCRTGLTLTLSAADRYDHLISLRAKAFRDKRGTVIACPDVAKHGAAYALTALPLHVTGIQDGLF